MALNNDCLYLVAEFIDHPNDWQNFAIVSSATAGITRKLKDRKWDEFRKKWMLVLIGKSRRIVQKYSPIFQRHHETLLDS